MNIALILAAGSGSRFDLELPKQLFKINGKTILEYSLDVVEELDAIGLTMLVINSAYKEAFLEIIQRYKKPIELCSGGSTRQKSVFNGLKSLEALIPSDEKTKVLIHDSARPFSRTVFFRVLEKSKTENVVVPVVKTKDTIYVINKHRVVDIPNRDTLFNVQTPQGFSFPLILECHRIAEKRQMTSFTDDGSLYTTIKRDQPEVVEGDQMNFKITDKKDMMLAEFCLTSENYDNENPKRLVKKDG